MLKKAMYGLRSAPVRWDDHFAEIMEDLEGFRLERLKSDPSVWFTYTWT